MTKPAAHFFTNEEDKPATAFLFKRSRSFSSWAITRMIDVGAYGRWLTK